jgi:L-histidine N-alpha-methyltransferase
LFEQITELPEYYPTRAERSILVARAAEIALRTGARTLVELGAGSAAKTRVLLDALRDHGTLRQYVPVDVSVSTLIEAGEALSREYPTLAVHAVAADFEQHLDRVPGGGPGLTAFLGGTIGNFEPVARAGFLAALRSGMSKGDWLLLGTDLVKDPATLIAAYDDSAGVTAEFNRNVLHVINRELGGDFDPGTFRHIALWDAEAEWIEMRLESQLDQKVRLPELELTVGFGHGEQVLTEISAKFRESGVRSELTAAGFGLREWWTDGKGRFALSLAQAT